MQLSQQRFALARHQGGSHLAKLQGVHGHRREERFVLRWVYAWARATVGGVSMGSGGC